MISSKAEHRKNITTLILVIRDGKGIEIRQFCTFDHMTPVFYENLLKAHVPVGKDLTSYKNICRHGLGYSVFETDYSDINSEALYYVPDGKTYEFWRIK